MRTKGMTLKNMGVVIDENEMAMQVLNGMSDRFDGLVSAVDAAGAGYFRRNSA